MSAKQNRVLRRRLAGSYLSSLASLSMVLLLVGVSALLLLCIPSLEDTLSDNLKLTVVLRDGTSAEKGISVKDRIESQGYVRSARYVSVKEGEAEMAEMLGEDFLDAFESSPVPSSVEVSLSREYLNPDSLALVKARLYSLSPDIDEVDYPLTEVSSLSSGLGKLAAASLVLAAVLLFISVVLINSTLRLSLYSKRLTIHTMLLVGATRSFVARPYVRAAVLEGLFASLIAIALFALAIVPAESRYSELAAVLPPLNLCVCAGVVTVFSLLVCLISSEVIVGKVCRLDNDELYYG